MTPVAKVLKIVSHSESETQALGQKLSAMLLQPNVVVLTGDLGAGKTVFVKGLAEGMGVKQDKVLSPTFSFVHEYHGNSDLYHFDLYRMSDIKELREIGWEDYLERDGLVVIEWGEKAGSLLPERYYSISFEILNESEREINVELVG